MVIFVISPTNQFFKNNAWHPSASQPLLGDPLVKTASSPPLMSSPSSQSSCLQEDEGDTTLHWLASVTSYPKTVSFPIRTWLPQQAASLFFFFTFSPNKHKLVYIDWLKKTYSLYFVFYSLAPLKVSQCFSFLNGSGSFMFFPNILRQFKQRSDVLMKAKHFILSVFVAELEIGSLVKSGNINNVLLNFEAKVGQWSHDLFFLNRPFCLLAIPQPAFSAMGNLKRFDMARFILGGD